MESLSLAGTQQYNSCYCTNSREVTDEAAYQDWDLSRARPYGRLVNVDGLPIPSRWAVGPSAQIGPCGGGHGPAALRPVPLPDSVAQFALQSQMAFGKGF